MNGICNVSVKGSIQCQCPTRPSMTIKSRAWWLDTSGDLLVWKPHRHRTADLSKATGDRCQLVRPAGLKTLASNNVNIIN